MSGSAGLGFFEAIETCLKKYAVFQGRAPRSEYWWFALFQFIIFAGLDSVILPHTMLRMHEFRATGVMPPDDAFHAIIRHGYTLVSLALLLPSIAVQVRRLHDTNRSGWWLLGLFAIPVGLGFLGGLTSALAGRGAGFLFIGLAGLSGFVVGILLLVWFCTKGTDGSNRFGADPLRDF